MKRRLASILCVLAGSAAAQSSGGLYVAGGTFGFTQTIERAVAQNPAPSRFFVLITGDALRGLSLLAPPEMVEARNLGARSGAVFLVCRRDIDGSLIRLNDLVSGVVPVRGWPPPGSDELPEGVPYYRDEDPAGLPKAADLLRRLRSTCS